MSMPGSNVDQQDVMEMIKEVAQAFARKQCPPSLVRAVEAGEWTAAETTWKRLAELGWLELMLPDCFDDNGLGAICTVSEELGRAAYPLPFPEMATLIIPLLAEFGTPDQRKVYLQPCLSGERRAAFAWPGRGMVYGARPEVAWPFTESNGEQLLVGYHLQGATLLVVPVRVADGTALVLVERPAGGWKESPEPDMANSAWSVIDLSSLSGARIELLGGSSIPQEALTAALDQHRLAMAAYIIGLSAEALDLAVGYAKERVQFDRPIGSFQAVQQRLADSVMEIAAARLLTIEATYEPTPALVSMACLQTCEAARKATFTAQQVWGGMGYTMEVDVQLFFRRARAAQLMLGQPWDLKEQIWEGL